MSELEFMEYMNEKETQMLTKELELERDSLKSEITKKEFKKAKEEIKLLKLENTRLQQELSEINEEYIRGKIKEILSENKQLSYNQPSPKKKPVYYSQSNEKELSDYKVPSDLDLNSLLQMATSGVIKTEELEKKVK